MFQGWALCPEMVPTVNFRNLTWNDDGAEALTTTECEWGNMVSKLGWQPPCDPRGAGLRMTSTVWVTHEEEVGLWALHSSLELLNQLATWPALRYLSELISGYLYHRKFVLHPLWTLLCQTCSSDVDLLGLYPRPPGGGILSHQGLVAPARDFPLCSISPLLSIYLRNIRLPILLEHTRVIMTVSCLSLRPLAHFPSLVFPIMSCWYYIT